jgi:hypothetical protein
LNTQEISNLFFYICKMKIIQNIINSFSNSKEGFSARKMTAFAFVLLAAWLHYKWVDHDNAVQALIVDCSVILICLGIITAQNIIQFKHGK